MASARPMPSRMPDDVGSPPPSDAMTLDRWLLDKVFGRR
jgi:hypothetical protein